MKVCTGTGGTGIHIVLNLPKYPVPVLMSYLTYQRSGTGNTGGIYRRYASVRTEHTLKFIGSPKSKKKNKAFLGTEPPNFRLGVGSRRIEISRDCPGRDKKGYFKHGTVHDWIEPSLD